MEKAKLPHRLWGWAKPFFPAETVFYLCIWLVLMTAGRDRLFQDPGTFWHVVLGEQILQTRQIPTTDFFSFTRYGQPMVADQWLAELLMALVHRLAGWEGLLLLTATPLAGLYAWLGARLLKAGIPFVWSVGVLAGVLLATAHNLHVRPLIATLVLQAVWFAGLLAVDAARASIRYLWLLTPLTVVWANLHGGVLGGLGTLVLTGVLWTFLACTANRGPIQTLRDWIHLSVLVAVCALAVLLNPYGMDLPRSWYATLSMNLGQWIQEHRPWHVQEPAGWAAIGLLVGYLAVLIPAVRTGKFQAAWVIPLVWFVLGLQRVRNLPLFAVTVALAIADVFPTRRKTPCRGFQRLPDAPQAEESEGPKNFLDKEERAGAGDLKEDLPGGDCWNRLWQRWMVPGVLVLVAFTLQTSGWKVPILGADWVRLSPVRWPMGLLPELQSASRQDTEGSAIFNDLDFGGFLIYFTPRWRVFIDDRCNLYGESFLRAYETARRELPAQLEQWRQEYGFQWALVRRGGRFDRYLSSRPDWKCLGRDQAAAWYRFQNTAGPAGPIPGSGGVAVPMENHGGSAGVNSKPTLQ